MNIGYIFKLWFSVILVTPVFISMSLSSGFNIEIYFYAVIFGLVLSFPLLLVALLLSLLLDNRIKNPLTLKVFYIVVTLAGMFITMYLFSGGDISFADGGFGDFMLWYGITIFLFGTIYKVKAVPEVSEGDEAV